MTLRTLPFPLKVLGTCLLLTIGLGYLFAISYLYLIDIEPHTKHGMGVVKAVIIKYYGNREASTLEAALQGGMGDYLSQPEKKRLIRWVRQGAKEGEFVGIRPIMKQACMQCHSADSGMSLPPLTTYAEISQYTDTDLGESFKMLVRVSHIHFFGLSFVFGLTGLIFAFSETSRMFRGAVIAIPFLSIWIDIGSWWFTKYDPLFAYTVIIGGAFMGLSLACQVSISLYEMWVGGKKLE